jgi:hypothetical protein
MVARNEFERTLLIKEITLLSRSVSTDGLEPPLLSSEDLEGLLSSDTETLRATRAHLRDLIRSLGGTKKG